MKALTSFLEGLIGLLRAHQLLEGVIILLAGIITATIFRLLSIRFLNSLKSRHEFDLENINAVSLIRASWITVILGSAHKAVPHLLDKASGSGFVVMAVIESILIVVWTVTLSQTLRLLSRRKTTSRIYSIEALQFLTNLAVAVILVNAGFMLLSVWQVNITPLLASAGIAGLAIALAAKDTLANFFGGVNLFMDRPFKQGDYVVLGTGERGAITEIGLRSTRIVTRDDVLICIPNSIIANSKIINESAPAAHHRVRIKLSVAYGSDLDEVEATLLDIARRETLVSPKPEPRVRLRALGESGLEFELLCWAHTPAERGLMQHELNKTIYDVFNSKGIIFPFPQRVVHIQKSD